MARSSWEHSLHDCCEKSPLHSNALPGFCYLIVSLDRRGTMHDYALADVKTHQIFADF